MIKLLIFDMAGTAVNEDNTVYKTIRNALARAGYHYDLSEVLLYGAGKEKWIAIRDILTSNNPAISEDTIDRIHNDFKDLLDTAYAVSNIRLFKSVDTVIKEMRTKGIKVAFNTGYKRNMAEYLLSKMNIIVGKDIDCLVASDDVILGRPHPDMINRILDQLNIHKHEAVKIGDSKIT